MEDRIKNLEIEVSYLTKAIEELKKERPVEIHSHYTYDYSGMKPMVINDLKGLQKFIDELE